MILDERFVSFAESINEEHIEPKTIGLLGEEKIVAQMLHFLWLNTGRLSDVFNTSVELIVGHMLPTVDAVKSGEQTYKDTSDYEKIPWVVIVIIFIFLSM